MAATTIEPAASSPLESSARPPLHEPTKRWTRFLLPVYGTLVLFYLVLPILVMILYSFNDSGPKKVSFRWQGFSLFGYSHLFAKPDLTAALQNSLYVAAISTVIATALGTLIALALVRHRFRGRASTDIILFMNISAPEIVLGASLLSLFLTFGVPRGIVTIIIAHVMFNIAYVAVTVRARLAGFDTSLEEAASDLGAGPWTTFRKVTLPLIFPGVLAGGLLAFALSIDDFVITNFNAGSVRTFPLWVYGAVKVGIPPQVFVMGTLIFVGGAVIAAATVIAQRRKTARAL
jgi:spermidine/putrescine transport system permease protein